MIISQYKNYFFFLLLAILSSLILIGLPGKGKIYSRQPVAQINGQTINLEIVNTPAQREQGLSNRAALSSSEGMLFVFPRADIVPFWNNQMKFSIDVIWIKDTTVIGLDQLPIDTGENVIIKSSQPINKVLEMPFGSVERFDIKVNDQFQFKNFSNEA